MIQTRGIQSLKIRLSAVDDPGDHRQEAARGSFQRPKLKIDGFRLILHFFLIKPFN